MKTRTIPFRLQLLDPTTQIFAGSYRVHLINPVYTNGVELFGEAVTPILRRCLIEEWIKNTHFNPQTREFYSSKYHALALKLDPITGEEIITSIFIERTKEPKELKNKLVSDYFPVMDNILSFSHLPDTYI